MDVIDRINAIIAAEGMNVSAFARKIGVGDQTIRGIVVQRRNKPSFDVLAKIIEAFPCVSAEWLLTEKGEMMKSQLAAKLEQERSTVELIRYLKYKDDKIEQLLLENFSLKLKLGYLKE